MNTFERIAQQYVESLGEIVPGFDYHFLEKKEFLSGIYYDFFLVDSEGNLPIDPPSVGGAVGFIIDKKTHRVDTLSHSDLRKIEDQQKELETVYNTLKKNQAKEESISWLKVKYKLNSIQLLKIKKIFSIKHVSKENLLEELDKIILSKQ